MPELWFKSTFRFDKATVQRLTDLLDLDRQNNRGVPLQPIEQVCITLNAYAGNPFQRINGLVAGVSQGTVQKAIVRVTDELLNHRHEFIKMPTLAAKADTSQRMHAKYHLHGFAYAVDGMQTRFEERPRHLPPTIPAQRYWCRKQFYAINVNVVAKWMWDGLDLHMTAAFGQGFG